MLQEQVQQYLKGTGLRTENLGLICLLEDYFELFFFKWMTIKTNGYKEN